MNESPGAFDSNADPSCSYLRVYNEKINQMAASAKLRGAIDGAYTAELAFGKAIQAHLKIVKRHAMGQRSKAVPDFEILWRHITRLEAYRSYGKDRADALRDYHFAQFLELNSSMMDPYSLLDMKESRELAYQLLASLQPKDRKLLECVYIERLAYREIQRIEEFSQDSLEALRVRASRALAFLRELNVEFRSKTWARIRQTNREGICAARSQQPTRNPR